MTQQAFCQVVQHFHTLGQKIIFFHKIQTLKCQRTFGAKIQISTLATFHQNLNFLTKLQLLPQCVWQSWHMTICIRWSRDTFLHNSTYPLHHLTGNFAVRTINNWVTICLLKALEHAWNSNHVCFVTLKIKLLLLPLLTGKPKLSLHVRFLTA